MNKTNIKIFISSTFKDLDIEREMLVKGVFPKVKSYAESKGLSLYFVDLRWGITSFDSLEIIKTCLDEIDNCIPYFIGIIGNRYGFVPKNIEGLDLDNIELYKNKSITEMEISYGVFNKIGRNKNIFAIKKECSHEQLIDLNSPDGDCKEQIDKLNNLKNKIIDYCDKNNVPLYNGYEDLNDFCDFFYHELIKLIDNEVLEIGDIIDFKQQNFLNNNIDGVFKNNYMFEYINKLIKSNINKIVIFGDSYIGKTTLLNHYFSLLENHIIINIKADCSLENIENLYKYLAKKLNIEYKSIGDVNNYLKEYNGEKMYIVINDINLLSEYKNANLAMLFPKELSNDIVLALSTNNLTQTSNLYIYDYFSIKYKEFDSFIFAEDFFNQECKRYGKSLSEDVLKDLRTTKFCRSFAVAKVILNFYLHEKNITFYPFLKQCNTLKDFYYCLIECHRSKEKFLSYVILLILRSINGPADLDFIYEVLEAIPSKETLHIELNKYNFTKAINEIHMLISQEDGKISLLNDYVKNALKDSCEKYSNEIYKYIYSIVEILFYNKFTYITDNDIQSEESEVNKYFKSFFDHIYYNFEYEKMIQILFTRNIIRYFTTHNYYFWSKHLIKLYNLSRKNNQEKKNFQYDEILLNYAMKNMLSNEEMLFLHKTLLIIGQDREATKLLEIYGLNTGSNKEFNKIIEAFDVFLGGSKLELNVNALQLINHNQYTVNENKELYYRALLLYFHLEKKDMVRYYFDLYKECCDEINSALMLFEGYLTDNKDKEIAYMELAFELSKIENNFEIRFLSFMHYYKCRLINNEIDINEFYSETTKFLFENTSLLSSNSHVGYKYYQYICTYCCKYFKDLKYKEEFKGIINSVLNKNFQIIVKIFATIANDVLNNELHLLKNHLNFLDTDIYDNLIETITNELKIDNGNEKEEEYSMFVDSKMQYLYQTLETHLNKLSSHYEWKKTSNEPLDIELIKKTVKTQNYGFFTSYILNDKMIMMGEYRIVLPKVFSDENILNILRSTLKNGDGFKSIIQDNVLYIGYSIKYTPDPMRIIGNGPSYLMSIVNISHFYITLFELINNYSTLSAMQFYALFEEAFNKNNDFLTNIMK